MITKKYGKAAASLFGKTATIIPKEDCIEIRTTGTWLIIAALWIGAGAFFWVSTVFNSIIVCCLFTLVGGVGGYLLTSKLYIGRLADCFDYKDINCFFYDAPEFTIAKSDQYLYSVRMLPKQAAKLFECLYLQLNNHETLNLVERNGHHYIEEVLI